MKLEPVTKFDKRKKATSKKKKKRKKSTMTSCRKLLMSLSFFRFMWNLEQSGNRIPDIYSSKFTFSLIVTFYLTKNENRSKKSLAQLSHYCYE